MSNDNHENNEAYNQWLLAAEIFTKNAANMDSPEFLNLVAATEEVAGQLYNDAYRDSVNGFNFKDLEDRLHDAILMAESGAAIADIDASKDTETKIFMDRILTHAGHMTFCQSITHCAEEITKRARRVGLTINTGPKNVAYLNHAMSQRYHALVTLLQEKASP
ncbi:MAG: hypothetical protein SFW62_05355 [Alphaproteobacteria bacterium]|nr:hypothetical protein [Alphaproteobacteria bacterium]